MNGPPTRTLIVAFALLAAAPPSATAQESKYRFGAYGDFGPNGALLRRVVPGGPVDRAGIEAGDLVVAIDGKPVRTQAGFVRALNASNGLVTLTVRRGRSGKVVKVQTALPPKVNGAGPALNAPRYFFGTFGTYGRTGMLVKRVTPNSPAAQAGIRPGDVVVQLDDQVANSQQAFTTALQGSEGVVLVRLRQARTGQIRRFKVQLALLP